MKAIKLLVSIGVCLLAGFIGSIFTFQAIPTWYATLNRPSIAPPNWIFGPVWTTLYILMGIALYLVWEKGLDKKEVKIGLIWFAIQLILNTKWSFLFFGMHSPLYGLVAIVFLWFSILLTIIYFFKVSKAAGWLLVPYILWVSFAAYLNYSFWLLNR